MSTNPFTSRQFVSSENDQQRPQNGLSYVSGATQDPPRFTTIPTLLDEAAMNHGSRDAVIFAKDRERLSWHDLKRRSDEVAAGLLALGIQRGDRVAIWAPNCVEWLLAQFGTARIGAILVNINPAYRTSELEYALNKVQCRVLIMARALKSSDYVAMVKELAPEINRHSGHKRLQLARFSDLEQVILIGEGEKPAGMMAFKKLIDIAGPAHQSRLNDISKSLDPDDAINIQFTSGTTGAPKGATLTHFNIVNNARYTAEAMRLTEKDKLVIPVPLYHCFGMVIGVLSCTAVGATMVFPGASFDAAETLSAIQHYRCTALHGVPTMFIAQLDHPEFRNHDVSSLRTGVMAGAPCPIETMRRVVSDMHMKEITIAYGMTETSPISFQSGVDDPLEKRVSTVGRIQPHAEVKIIDEQGRIVPVGKQGELCTRGYLVMQGYWEDHERTHESIDQAGWMHSGDLATLDAEGYCNIVGRVKDMLIRGGENVYPREVEEFLFRHPKIQNASVFGLPDAKYGEEVCAWIILKPGQSASAEEIQSHCQGQIAHYKIPRIIRFVPELPLTATGKPQKFVMREKMIQELKLTLARTA